jgi:hypothetical protein
MACESVTEEGEGIVIGRLGWYLDGETKEVEVTWLSEQFDGGGQRR